LTSRYLWRVALISFLCVALSTSSAADQLQKTADTALTVGIVAVAGVVVVVIVLVHNSTQKRTITGCVSATQAGLTLTDEKDKRLYALSGDAAGVTPNERMTLRLKKLKTKGSNVLTWQTLKINKDFGACPP
jgi:hypothetical protein